MALEQAPEGAGVPLDAVVRAYDEHREIEGGERPLRLGGEIDVPGGVHQRDRGVCVFEGCLGGEDRDATVALHEVGVEVGVAAVDAPAGADGARVEQHRFCECGLTCVDVRQYADNRLPHRSPERCVLTCGCNRLPGERLGQDVRRPYRPVPGA